MYTDITLLKDKIVRALDKVSIYEDALSAMLGQSVKLPSADSEGWHKKVKCPFHDDTHPSFVVNSITGGFKCFAGGCNRHGSLFDFWIDYKGLNRDADFAQAVAELAQLAGIDVKEWQGSKEYRSQTRKARRHDQSVLKTETKPVNKAKTSDEARLAIDESIVEEFHKLLGPSDFDYLCHVRGLTLGTIQKRKIGWNPEPRVKTGDNSWVQGRYTIPIYNEKGEVRNIRHYSQHATSQYKMLNYKPDPQKPGYGSPPRIYPLQELVAKNPRVICICEGEFDTILLNQKLEEAGIADWLAITNTHGAGTFEVEWLEYLYNRAVYFIYDADEAGQREAASHCSKYLLQPLKAGRFIEVKNVHLPLEGSKEYKDITDYFQKLNYKLSDLLTVIQDTQPLEVGGVAGDEATIPPIEVGNLLEVIKDRQYIDKRVRVPLTISGQSNKTYHAVRSYRVTRCPMIHEKDGECCSDMKEKIIPYGHDLFIHSSVLSKARVIKNLNHLACEKGAACWVEVQKKVVMEEHFAHQTVKRFLARENSEGKMENVHELTPVSVYILQPENHVQIQPQDYIATGWVRSHPENSQVSLFIEDMEPQENDWENFQVTEEAKQHLKVFQEMSFCDILQDISNHVTHIYESPDILAAVLLTYCSPIWIRFNDEPTRGWINSCIIGDSGVGKSSTYMRIADYIDLGDLFSVLTGGRTGLLYAIRQRMGEWHIRIGRYVSAHRKIIAIDEAQEAEKAELKAMAISMDKGELDISRVMEARYSTCVRLLFLMNPPEGKTLNSYPHGCLSLAECFDPMFIRRLDIAVFCPGRRDNEFYNRPSQPTNKGKISADDLRTLVHWAWTRSSAQTSWEADAVAACLKEATALADDYGDATDVPLLNAADCRFTLARLSTAHAILTGSFSEDYQSVVVTTRSVDEVVILLRSIYSDQACNLAYYSSISRHKNRLSDYDQIKAALEKVIKSGRQARNKGQVIQDEKLFCQLILIMRHGDPIRPLDLRDHLSSSSRWIKEHIAVLHAYSLVELTKNGWKSTPKFNSFMARWITEKITDYDTSGMPHEVTVKDMLDSVYSKIGDKIVNMIANPASKKERKTNEEEYQSKYSDAEYASSGSVNENSFEGFPEDEFDQEFGDI